MAERVGILCIIYLFFLKKQLAFCSQNIEAYMLLEE